MAPAIRPTRTDSRPTTSGSRCSRRRGLTNILENYAQIVETEGSQDRQEEARANLSALSSARRSAEAAWPMSRRGRGRRYLIQHSAGSGKSNSIAWLAHQLIGLRKDENEVFDSIIVVTDRRILDQQIRETIKQFAAGRRHVGAVRRAFRRPARVHRRAARRSSSPRCKSSRSFSTKSATSTEAENSPSSSTRRIPAKVVEQPLS